MTWLGRVGAGISPGSWVSWRPCALGPASGPLTHEDNTGAAVEFVGSSVTALTGKAPGPQPCCHQQGAKGRSFLPPCCIVVPEGQHNLGTAGHGTVFCVLGLQWVYQVVSENSEEQLLTEGQRCVSPCPPHWLDALVCN